MFDLSAAPGPVRPEIVDRFELNWGQLTGPGTWLDGETRRAIAVVARAARADEAIGHDLADSVYGDVATRIAAEPASTTEAWIGTVTDEIGEEQYVEAMGVATRVVVIDTFMRLMGIEPPPIPEASPGEPPRTPVEPRPKRVRSWIAVGPSLVPPFTQALVPEENDQTYPTIETLYMTGEDMEDPDFTRGMLHRTQIELVASVVSYGNECFY